MSIEKIEIGDLTEVQVTGQGVFDILMQATKQHLEQEYKLNRIKGPEYSTVYLGALQQVMQTSMEFLLQQQRAGLEAELLKQQVILAQVEVEKARAQVLLTEAQTANAVAELAIIQANAQKIPAEIAQLEAQTGLITQQTVNAVTEELVLQGQKCKLDAEFDLIQSNVQKSAAEITLLNQKVLTERAQVQATGVDGDSVIGKQKALYTAQTEGFRRDAEQKAAKILADSWGVRRSTDEGVVADGTNKLDDPTIGRAISKLLEGIQA